MLLAIILTTPISSKYLSHYEHFKLKQEFTESEFGLSSFNIQIVSGKSYVQNTKILRKTD